MALGRCLASVARQSDVQTLEQIVIVDHLGIGIDGMYTRVPDYADAVHGSYVHVLADDDELASPDVMAYVHAFAEDHGMPPVILVAVQKGPLTFTAPSWPPELGNIDLGSLIVRADVWKAHAADWGHRYEGDFDFASALHRAGHAAVYCPVLFLRGAQSRGAAEAA
jgi:hypothetical protein